MYPEYKSFVKHILWYFLPVYVLPFHFLNDVFERAEDLNCDQVQFIHFSFMTFLYFAYEIISYYFWKFSPMFCSGSFIVLFLYLGLLGTLMKINWQYECCSISNPPLIYAIFIPIPHCPHYWNFMLSFNMK